MSGPLVQALEKRRQEDLAKTQPLTPGTLEWAWAQAQKPFKGYWDRQGLMAREGLAMADQGAQQVQQGDLSGLAGMVLGPANYLSSPINALFPIEEAQTQLPKEVSPFVAGGLELMALAAPGPKGGKLSHGPREFFRGTNPGSTERISTGLPEWDQHLFAASNVDAAKNYGSSIEKISAKPEAKILYEGTADWVRVAGKWRKGENMLQYANRAAAAAKAAGYDAAHFQRQSDIGTAIFNQDKFIRDQALANLTEASEGITAYHGSPHTFDKFDMSKIGTGEGAQAYGHGLYFAENEKVAGQYKKMLANNAPWNVPNKTGADKAAELLINDPSISDAHLIDALEAWKPGTSFAERQAAVREGRNMASSWKPEGSMYQVRLNVKPDELLDWDRPLSEQPIAERTKEILKSSGIEAEVKQVGLDPMSMTGEGLHGWIRDPKQATKATEQLKAAGIKGIRYKDQGSRSSEGGTYNYVIFDDKLVDILKRYAIPFTLGAGGAAIVSGQDMPPEVASQLGPQA